VTRRRALLLVSVLTACGAALRFFRIDVQSLWLDELFSVLIARRNWVLVLADTAQGDTNPPLYNLLLHFSLQFGSDEVAARVVSFIFATATIPLFYALARDLFDERSAFLATAVLMINPLHIFYAQEARMYAQLAFFTLAAIFFFLRAWRIGRMRDWILFVLATTLAFYTHSLAFLNLLALDVFALLFRQTRRERWHTLALAHVAIALLFAPWMVALAQQAARVQAGFWGIFPSLLALFSTLYLFLFSNVLPAFVVPFALFAALALIVFALLAAVRVVSAQRDDAPSMYFVLMILFVPLLGLFLLSFIRPIFVERTILPASFGLYLLLTWAVVNAPPRVLNRVLGVAVLLAMLAALPNYYFDPETQKPQMRQAARALAAQIQPGDVVAHTSDSSALAFMYYAPSLSNHFLAGDPDYITTTTRGRTGRIAGLEPEDLNAIVAEHSRVWLVVALDHNEEYQKARVSEFDARWARCAVVNVDLISLVLYDIGRTPSNCRV